MAFGITFGGLTIDGIAEWGERLPSRVTAELFPRRHGGLVSNNAFLAPRVISISGETTAASESALRSYLNTLNWTLTNKGRAPLVLRDDLRFLNAIKSNFTYRFSASRAPSLRAEFEIEFIADDPFWYKSTESTGALTFDTGGVISPVMTNSGLEATPPVIEFRAVGGSRTNFTLTNTTVGISMQFTGTVAAGKSLFIDCGRYTVDNNGSNGLGNFAGWFFDLQPGNNNFALSGAQCDLYFTWRERWL